MTNPPLPTFEIAGCVDDAGSIYRVDASAIVATAEDARAIVASLPKSWRVKATTLHGRPEGVCGYIVMTAWLKADGVNGGTNETGMKRVRAFTKRVPWKHVAIFRNSTTEQQFTALLAG